MHAKTGDLKSAHLPDVHSVIQYCKTSHHVADTAVHLGKTLGYTYITGMY